jgi:hypothetical protein
MVVKRLFQTIAMFTSLSTLTKLADGFGLKSNPISSPHNEEQRD